ncbi:hypothetical protein DNTS_023923, partial [Danionella cerebrum]
DVKMGFFTLLIRASVLALSVLGQAMDVDELARRNADFATRLYSRIASSNDDNVAVSTLGATLALATLAAGAGGATLSELLQGIGLDAMMKDGGQENVQMLLQQLREATAQIQATALFIKQDVNVEDSFRSKVKQFYNADVQNVNYANAQLAKGTINDYIRGRTGDKVKDVVQNIDAQSMATLISAAFFTGQWLDPFNVTFTQDERFYVNKYNIVQVPMMLRSGKYHLAYDPTLKVGILKLPCENGIAMLMLLPDEDVDYTYIDESMTGEVFRGWVAKLKKTKLEIQLPRFSLQQSTSLSASLSSLGIDFNTIAN